MLTSSDITTNGKPEENESKIEIFSLSVTSPLISALFRLTPRHRSKIVEKARKLKYLLVPAKREENSTL